MSFARAVVILIAAALILLAACSFFPPQAKTMDRASATNAVLRDAREAYPNASLKIISIAGNETTGWRADVKIALDPNSPCPKVWIRHYELLPIRFREEKIIKECKAGGAIVFEEEAVIASKKSRCAKDAIALGASGYPYLVSREQVALIKECRNCVLIPAAAAAMVAGSNQSMWIVEWRHQRGSAVVVLDAWAHILNESC